MLSKANKDRVEEVREAIANIFKPAILAEHAIDQILSLKDKDGKPMLGIISDDQNVTEWKLKDIRDELGNALYRVATQDMVEANFVKLIKEDTNE